MMNSCFFCGVSVEDDRYCEGCTTSVCEKCDTGPKKLPKRHHVHRHVKGAAR